MFGVALLALAAVHTGVLVRAEDFTSGHNRYIYPEGTPASQQAPLFNAGKVASTLGAIINTLHAGPNRTIDAVLPVKKLYGVNLGNWLLYEPWMSPGAWIDMGGQFCSQCSACRQSEWSLSNYLGREETNRAFKEHWQTWMTQEDVDGIVRANLNTVRIPLPFWIIEDLVDTKTEPYAQGGLDELIRGLNMLKAAGLNLVLDHHALPGVSSRNQMFAGNCTSDIQFYSSPNDYNYKRAVTWSIVMAWLSHVHPAFSTVFSIEAINEPEQNYALTPGLDRFEKAFVLGIRAIELTLGIICDKSLLLPFDAFADPIARAAIKASIPIITKLARKYTLTGCDVGDLVGKLGTLANTGRIQDILLGNLGFDKSNHRRKCLATQFMNRDWQYSTDPTNNPVPNPADAARGPQLYDNHLYFSFGGVADANENAYLTTICNLTRVEDAAAIGNAPLYFGEWSLATNFDTNDDFLRKWGDSQKLAYSKGAGWTFWNWKVAQDAQVPDYRLWSYRDAVASGLLTARPQDVFDPNVCAPYLSN